MKQVRTDTITVDKWQSLYALSGASALILLVYCLATMLIMVFTGGQPSAVKSVFEMLQENRLIGLLRLDLLTVFCMPLYYVLFLGFFIALRKTNQVYTTLATMFVFVGVTLFLATPSAFSYLFLSDQYAAAQNEAARAQLLAAGEAILAADMWHGSGAILGGVLLQTGAVIISMIMLRDKTFGKAAAYTGILTHGLDLAHILFGFFAPSLGVLLMVVAGPLYLLWFPLVARGFIKLRQMDKPALQRPAQVLAGGD
jgi:hypothetical protein